MLDLMSIVAAVGLAGALAFGFWRKWPMLYTLVIAMAIPFVLGLLTAARPGVSIGGSPILDELAWRPGYLSLEAWMHWPTIFTSMFLHADVIHFLSNLLVFVLMGLGFEERVGRWRFLTTFAVSGVVGTVLHSAINLGPFSSMIPVVGASGAVFGIIGAYATAYPRDRVVLFFFLIIPNVPVYIAAVLYTALELVAIGAIGTGGSVAHYAHLGGLVGGVFMALLLMKRGNIPHPDETGAGRPKRTREVHEEALAPLVQTSEQKLLYERLLDNQDEPELAHAWLERLASTIPCPECQNRMEAGDGVLRCRNCGHKVTVERKKQG